MSNNPVDRLIEIGFSDSDVGNIITRCGNRFSEPDDIRLLIDTYAYDYSWEREYVVQSARVALRGDKLTCINAAVAAYTLMECFPQSRRQMLAIHRRDPAGVECGHVVALYTDDDGRMRAFGKSNYDVLNKVSGPFPNEVASAVAFGKAYTKIGFTPLYFGFYQLEDIITDPDWRTTPEQLNFVCDYMMGHYQYCFDVTTVPSYAAE